MNNIILIIIISIMLSACVPVAPGSLSAQMLTATSTAAPTRTAVLTATPTEPIVAPTPAQDVLTLAGLHNCRADGSISAPVLAVLPDGAVLAVLARVDGWALVVAAGTPCWVAFPAGN